MLETKCVDDKLVIDYNYKLLVTVSAVWIINILDVTFIRIDHQHSKDFNVKIQSLTSTFSTKRRFILYVKSSFVF